jgi:hypothetical protein
MDALKPFAPPRNIHEACKICDQHYLPEESQRADLTRRYLSCNDQDAQRLLLPLVQGSRDTLSHVRDVLASHGDLVISRWKKLSLAKRRELLSTASPMLFGPQSVGPATSRIEMWQEGGVIHEAIPGIEANGFVQDWIKLISLLHVRCEYGPSQWAAFDTRSTQNIYAQSESSRHAWRAIRDPGGL